MQALVLLLAMAAPLANSANGAYTLCSKADNAWLPSGCCIASADTGWRCVNGGVTIAYDDCQGGPPPTSDLSGCMSYAFGSDAGKASLHAGKGFVWWFTASTTFPPCPSHGNITVAFSAAPVTA